jgi:3'-phosphoadenosine 5'-phosphosulfate (PAPS) 3'-phosphatase
VVRASDEFSEEMQKRHRERAEMLKVYKEREPESQVIIEGEFEEFDPKEATEWIDPLDGTSNFIQGNFSCVTVIIGLTIKGESRIGIVHNQYFDIDYESQPLENFQPRTFFATIEHGLYVLSDCNSQGTDKYWSREANYLSPFDPNKIPDYDNVFKVAHSA